MWASIWDYANKIEWTTGPINMQIDGASDTFKRYAKLYEQANAAFFDSNNAVFDECVSKLKTLREQFDKSDWERLIASTQDGRARYENKRIMNEKFPPDEQ